MRGNVHTLNVLNVGFVPELDANQMRRIAHSLTARFKNRNANPQSMRPKSKKHSH